MTLSLILGSTLSLNPIVDDTKSSPKSDAKSNSSVFWREAHRRRGEEMSLIIM
jgi:hypothetical protein